MAQVIRSGAFLQQCWSVHPLCVTVKRIADDGTIVLLDRKSTRLNSSH